MIYAICVGDFRRIETEMRISVTQRKVLNLLYRKGNFMHYMPWKQGPYHNPYYFSHLEMEHFRLSTVESLLKKKLVKRIEGNRIIAAGSY